MTIPDRPSWIPNGSFSHVEADEPFDPEYMRALFDYGYRRILSGEAWRWDSE